MGISLSVRPVDQQRRQLAVSFYFRCYYVGSGVGVSTRRIGSAMNRFYTMQTKIFVPKNLFFLKVPTKLFVAQKINLDDAKKSSVFRNYVHITGQRSSTVSQSTKVGLEKYCGDVSLKLGVCLASFLIFKQLQPGCLVLVC